jgi:cytoskeletal protein CcmA (bactofilin family)
VCAGPVRLDGNVSGTLVADDFLLIDRNSTVIADLNVQELIVRGTVRGNIRAMKRVALEETARIEGDIETTAIEVRDGAQIVGKIDVARRAPLESPGNTRLDNATEEAERKFAEASKAIFDAAAKT